MVGRQGSFRIEGSRGQEITSLEDWLEHAPPKKRVKHWKPGRSALELARAWLDDGRGPTEPPEVAALLDNNERTRGFEPELAIPECITRLDDLQGEHRNHDLIVVGCAPRGRTLLAVESKADESFGSYTVSGYLTVCERREKERPAKIKEAIALGRRPPGRSNAPERIEQLCRAIFGPPANPVDTVHELARPLRYQLVTALAGALIEARERKCTQAVLLVHEFLSRPDVARGFAGTVPLEVTRNDADLDRFAQALTDDQSQQVQLGQLLGPLTVPGDGRVPGQLPLLVGKTVRQLN